MRYFDHSRFNFTLRGLRVPYLLVKRIWDTGSDNSSGDILLSSTPGITVGVGFPFTASPESPCASETHGLFLAVNGRTSTAPSRPERGSLTLCTARILRWSGNLLSIAGPVSGIGVTPLIST